MSFFCKIDIFLFMYLKHVKENGRIIMGIVLHFAKLYFIAVHLYMNLCMYQAVYLCINIFLSICVSIYFYLSVYQYISIYLCINIFLPICLSIYFYLSVYQYISIYLSINLFLSICLSV